MDWFYWKEDAWGSHEFDPARFPDPKGMIDKVHAQNAHFMISVWPKFYPTTANYKELDAAGFMYRGNVEDGCARLGGPGLQLVVLRSVLEAGARHVLAPGQRQAGRARRRRLVDGCHRARSAFEPRHRFHQGAHRADGARPGRSSISTPTRWCTRAACTQGSRAARPDKRVFILTRSGTAGIQRNAAAVWSGDIASRWDDLYNQISAGVGIGYSGLPNWTFDIGGFANESRYSTQNPKPADLEEWRELNLRWFQFGAFVPLFRSHGEYPFREIFNLAPQGSEVYDSLVWHDQLRYRLLPYIYTVAADTCHRDGTIMRGLAMDFTDDPPRATCAMNTCSARHSWSRRCTSSRRAARPVYLPAGAAWYDFHTGSRYDGGQQDRGGRAAQRMPLFVRAGVDPAGGSADPVHRREAGRRHHAAGVHRRGRRLRTVRRRRRQLRL